MDGNIVWFAGTVVILRPGYEALSLGPILALMAAMTWGSAIIIIKPLVRPTRR